MPPYELPKDVRIYYRHSGESHTFTSPDLPGLVVGHPSLQIAYETIAVSISAIVEAVFGVVTEFQPDHSFDEIHEIVTQKNNATRLLSSVMRFHLTESNMQPSQGTRRRRPET